jgi:hypothetical protein
MQLGRMIVYSMEYHGSGLEAWGRANECVFWKRIAETCQGRYSANTREGVSYFMVSYEPWTTERLLQDAAADAKL